MIGSLQACACADSSLHSGGRRDWIYTIAVARREIGRVLAVHGGRIRARAVRPPHLAVRHVGVRLGAK